VHGKAGDQAKDEQSWTVHGSPLREKAIRSGHHRFTGDAVSPTRASDRLLTPDPPNCY
jgi:hypothetical protein